MMRTVAMMWLFTTEGENERKRERERQLSDEVWGVHAKVLHTTDESTGSWIQLNCLLAASRLVISWSKNEEGGWGKGQGRKGRRVYRFYKFQHQNWESGSRGERYRYKKDGNKKGKVREKGRHPLGSISYQGEAVEQVTLHLSRLMPSYLLCTDRKSVV